MKQHKKVMIFLTLSLLFAVAFSPIFNKESSDIFLWGRTDAFAEDDKEKDSDKKEGEAAQEEPCPECPECPDPAKVVLRGLEEKKTTVERQQRILLQGKKELEAFEEQIDEKLVNLKAIEKQIKADMALLDQKKTLREQEEEAAYEAKIGRLVKMYAGMKPKSAAQIVDKMNLEVAQEIFLRMREASASLILAFVDSEKAAKISERLAFKRKM